MCFLLTIRRLLIQSKARQQCHNLQSCCVNLDKVSESPKAFRGKKHQTLSQFLEDSVSVLYNREGGEANGKDLMCDIY